jgi:hypothetical protein
MPASLVRLLLCALVGALHGLGPADAQRRDYRVVVTNATDVALEYFYFSGCGTNNWGRDRLGTREVIASGARRLFDMHDGNSDCCRDMRAVFITGATRQRLGVDVCKVSEWVVR